MFFSCGVNSSSSGRQLVVSAPSSGRPSPEWAAGAVTPTQVAPGEGSRASSAASSTSEGRAAEPIRAGHWTHVSPLVSVRALTREELRQVFERQKRTAQDERRRALRAAYAERGEGFSSPWRQPPSSQLRIRIVECCDNRLSRNWVGHARGDFDVFLSSALRARDCSVHGILCLGLLTQKRQEDGLLSCSSQDGRRGRDEEQRRGRWRYPHPVFRRYRQPDS